MLREEHIPGFNKRMRRKEASFSPIFKREGCAKRPPFLPNLLINQVKEAGRTLGVLFPVNVVIPG